MRSTARRPTHAPPVRAVASVVSLVKHGEKAANGPPCVRGHSDRLRRAPPPPFPPTLAGSEAPAGQELLLAITNTTTHDHHHQHHHQARNGTHRKTPTRTHAPRAFALSQPREHSPRFQPPPPPARQHRRAFLTRRPLAVTFNSPRPKCPNTPPTNAQAPSRSMRTRALAHHAPIFSIHRTSKAPRGSFDSAGVCCCCSKSRTSHTRRKTDGPHATQTHGNKWQATSKRAYVQWLVTENFSDRPDGAAEHDEKTWMQGVGKTQRRRITRAGPVRLEEEQRQATGPVGRGKSRRAELLVATGGPLVHCLAGIQAWLPPQGTS